MAYTPGDISRSVVSSLKRGNTSLFGWADANPYMFAGAAASAVLAPFVMKNDDRGYFSTATITTPLITAAALTAPRFFPKARDEVQRLVDVVRQVPTDYGFRDGVRNAATGRMNLAEASAGYRSGRISYEDYMHAVDESMGDMPIKSVTAEQLEREQGSFHKMLFRLQGDPGRRRDIENAFFHARLKDSGAADKINWHDLSNIAPKLTDEEIQDVVKANKGNIDWIREMNFRFQEAGKSEAMSAGNVIPQLADLAGSEERAVAFHSFAGEGAAMLAEQRPDLHAELQAVLKTRKGILDPGMISVAVMPGNNQAIGKIVGLQIDTDLSIPVLGSDGSVRLGKSFENVGVSRLFITHDADIAADVYGIRGLAHGKDLRAAKKFVKSELGRAQFTVGRDPLNRNPLEISQTGVTQATANQIQFYSNQGVMANAPGSFRAVDGDEGIWSKMRPNRWVEEQAYLVAERGFVRTTGGTKLDVLEKDVTRLLDPMGRHNAEKESTSVKSFNKAFWVEVPDGSSDAAKPLTTATKAFSRTDYGEMSEFAVRSLQITPSQRALFGDLPEWNELGDMMAHTTEVLQTSGATLEMLEKSRLLSLELALTKIGFKERGLKYIMADTGLAANEAEGVWNQMLPFLSNRKNYNAMREIGYIGEGSRIMSKGVGARAKRVVNYIVNENALHDGILKGEAFGSDVRLGWRNGASMFAQGESNRILQYSANKADKTLLLSVEEEFGEQGMKVHNLGKQTVSRAVESEDMERIARGFNNYFRFTGQGGRVADEVNSVVLEQYNSAKPNNPLQILHDVVSDTFRRMTDAHTGSTQMLAEPLDSLAGESVVTRLGRLGYRWDSGTLINQTSKIGSLRESEELYTEAAGVIRKMMDEVGSRIKSKQIRGDAFMQSYIDWSLKNGDRGYLDYVMMRGLPETMSVSDHMSTGHADRVGFTRDAFNQLHLSGDHEIAEEIARRVKVDGSPGMALEFIEHTDPANLNYSKQFGSHVMTLDEAVGPGLIPKLSEAQGRTMVTQVNGANVRVPNIFDPKHSGTQENYSIQMKVGERDYFIPVLGRDAYKGKANPHDLMGYSANEWERELRTVLQTGRDVNEGSSTPDAFHSALDEYKNAVRGSAGAGKESLWRAPNVDPLGFEGRSTGRASTLTYGDGSVNPFEVGVGDNYLAEMSESERAFLEAGGRLQAVSVRHPINSVVKSYVKYDPRLNGWQIGADPVMSRMMRMDFDGDRVSFHLVNTKGSLIAASKDLSQLTSEEVLAFNKTARFHNDITNPDSLQARMSKFRDVFEGVEGNPREYVAGSLTELFKSQDGREIGQIAKFVNTDVVKTVKARTAAGSVGMLSNTFSLLEASLVANRKFRDPEEVLRFHEFGYDVIREASIAAQKLKAGNAYSDLTTLMSWNNRLRSALETGTESGKNEFANVLTEGAAQFGKLIPINDAHRSVFEGAITPEMEAAGKINPYLLYAQKYRDVLDRVHEGHLPEVGKFESLMVAGEGQTEKFISANLSEISRKGAAPWVRRMARRGGRAADMSAEAIAAENEGIRAVAGNVKRAASGLFDQAGESLSAVTKAARGSGAGKTLAIGAAIAAGAGLLFGSIHSPREGQALSANSFRPEEKVGTDGGIPGEDVGSLAPANPPRRVRPAAQGVRTAVVAPIGRTTELEVHTRADDRSAAAEAAKMAARMAGGNGNQNVSITYRDTTRLDSLRTREKVREAMEQS